MFGTKVTGVAWRWAILLFCFVISLSAFISCDESESGGGGEYKDPTQSESGSEETESGESSEGEGDTESGSDEGGSDLPTVEFPVLPFD